MDRVPLSLTDQELRACQLAAQHLTVKEIAAVMQRSIPTVNRYMSIGKAKLGVSNKRQIYAELKRRNLLGEYASGKEENRQATRESEGS